MTDYLELLSEENEQALLELERRLERALSGLWNTTEKEAPSPTAGEGTEGTAPAEALLRDAAGVTWPEEPEKGEGSPARQEWPVSDGSPAVLLDEVQRWERVLRYPFGAAETAEGASVRSEGFERTEDGKKWPADLSVRKGYGSEYPLDQRGTGFTAQRALAGRGRSAAEAAQDWTEQADRAFRRDSRRYDGGFYLY